MITNNFRFFVHHYSGLGVIPELELELKASDDPLQLDKRGWLGGGQTPPFQHCLHTGILDSVLDYLFIFRCKHRQLPDAQCHVNMACNQWLETWDIAIIYTGGTRICVTVQWMSVDCMTLSPTKLNLIWTAAVNSRVMTGESQTQSWSIASVHPLHYFVAKTHSYLTVYDR